MATNKPLSKAQQELLDKLGEGYTLRHDRSIDAWDCLKVCNFTIRHKVYRPSCETLMIRGLIGYVGKDSQGRDVYEKVKPR